MYFLFSQLNALHKKLTFDYQTKAHPSVIKNMYSVFIPPLNEQHQYREICKLMDKILQLKEKEIKMLKLQKKGLMQQLLTGKIRVQS